LPTASGEAARFKFAATPAWARDAPGWYVPDPTSAGLGLLDFVTHREDRIPIKLKSFRNLPLLLTEAKSVGIETIYSVDWYEGLPGARAIDFWQAKGDYLPRGDLGGEAAFRDGIAAALLAVLEELRPTAAAIDAALAGRAAPAATAYLKTLLTARRNLAKFIDHGSSVAPVRSDFPRAAAWRFTGTNGMALTAVSVSDESRPIVFPNAPGTWQDGITGDVFTAQGNRLTVTVPAHGIRLLHAG
jgi:hypothetical protein